ncbi:MAG: helix-hairpin-helix domain-containing protein [Lautropia sp.]|nr:helix-hairpin-helix domain-containing protein [Lautropia sp.]
MKNPKTSFSSIRTPAMGMLAALALAFAMSSAQAADTSDMLSGAATKMSETKSSVTGKLGDAMGDKTETIKMKKDEMVKKGAKLKDKAAHKMQKGSEKSTDMNDVGMSTSKLDLNMASETELAQLPGIGEARAKAIVNGRPYGAKDELKRKKILPASVYAKIKDRIVAHKH